MPGSPSGRGLRGTLLCVALLAIAAFTTFTASAGAQATFGDPTLVGDWPFTTDTTGDITGNWTGFNLNTASVSDGQLVVSGSGGCDGCESNWAYDDTYNGPTITDKTLMSWLTLDSTDAYAGSPMSIFNDQNEQFDAIDYGELQQFRWMPGSEAFVRTQQFPNDAADDYTLGSERQIAISYADNGDGSETITGCLNGQSLGSYAAGGGGNEASFDSTSGTTEALFGPRHIRLGTGNEAGALAAHIDESRIYDVALTCAQLADADFDKIIAKDDNCPNAYNPSQADSNSNSVGDACEPGLAAGKPTASKLVNHGAFNLKWSASSAPDLDSYRVERRQAAYNPAAPWQTVQSGLTATSVSLSNEPEGQWVYRVVAHDSNGDDYTPSGITPTVYVDTEAPNAPTLSIAGGQTSFTGSDGEQWYLGHVIIDVADNGDLPNPGGSGVAKYATSFSYTKNGVSTASTVLNDKAGNKSAPGTIDVRVDTQKPVLTMACGSLTVKQGANRSVAWSATDNGSGIAGAASGSNQINTDNTGPSPVTQTVADNVGHTTSKTCSYTVKS